MQAAACRQRPTRWRLPTGRLVQWVNPAKTRLTGYAPAERMVVIPAPSKTGAHPPEFNRDMGHPFDRQILRGRTGQSAEYGSQYHGGQTSHGSR